MNKEEEDPYACPVGIIVASFIIGAILTVGHGCMRDKSTVPEWFYYLLAINMSVPIFMGLSFSIYAIIKKCRKVLKPIPYESTKRTIMALLTSPKEWTFDKEEQKINHDTGLTICIYDKCFVKTEGIFSCSFNEKQSEEIIKAVDFLQSAKLTYTMGPENKELEPSPQGCLS